MTLFPRNSFATVYPTPSGTGWQVTIHHNPAGGVAGPGHEGSETLTHKSTFAHGSLAQASALASSVGCDLRYGNSIDLIDWA